MKHSARQIAMIILATLLFCLLLLYTARPKADMSRGTICISTDDSRSAEDIQADLDARGEGAGMELYMNGNVVCQRNRMLANLLIQNAESNPSDLKVVLTYGGTLLYRSDIVPPGYKIESARLFEELDPGIYPCNAEFHILDGCGEDKSVINTGILVTVLD